MFNRRTTGSVVCPGCGSLVGVKDSSCYNCGRANPGLFGFAPMLRQLSLRFGFAQFVIAASSVLYVISLLLSGSDMQVAGGGMSFLAPSQTAIRLLGASGAYPVVVESAWWTVLSASWLHGSFLHILFNMMWVRDLGPGVAEMYGAARMIIIYTIASVCGFLLSSVIGYYLPMPLFGSSFTLGASAPIFGLLGALVHYGRRGGSQAVRSQAVGYAVALFVFGVIMPGVDNAAHAGGFVGGYLASVWLDPLKPERLDHYVGAAICLVATLLSIVASVVTVLV